MIAEILQIKPTKNPLYVSVRLEEFVVTRTINGRKLKSAIKPKKAWGVFSASLLEGMTEGDYLDNIDYSSKVSLTPFYEDQEAFTDGKYYENRFRSTNAGDREMVDGEALRLEAELRKAEKDKTVGP